MSWNLRTAIAVLALAAVTSCHTPATEIVLRVETDMDQGPGQTLTDVRVTITSQGEMTPHFDHDFALGVATGLPLLPADLGITPRNGDGTRTIDVQVHAISNGTELFTYHAVTPFEANHTGELLVFLAGRCRLDANRVCLPDQTCGRYGCESVNHSQLPPFDPDASTDSAPVDANNDVGIDVTVTDVPNDTGFDATSDVPNDAPPCGMGMIRCGGQCVAAMDDPHNCGACGDECSGLPHIAGTPTCSAGACVFTCAPNWDNCNATASDGCETDLTTTTHCGSCGHACTGGTLCGLHGTTYDCGTSCSGSTPTQCGLQCVDTQTDTDNCGMCGHSCPVPPNGSPTCSAGTCGIACNTGFHNCSGQCVSNASVNNCGGLCTPCATPPNASASCVSGSCSFTCSSGFADCDLNPTNGCEADLSQPAHCGSCSTICNGTAPLCVPAGGSFGCGSSCTSGATCTPTTPCRTGTVTCPGGTPTCSVTGNLVAGSPCSGGVCNSAGNCVACAAGSLCSTGNECESGVIQCDTGAPVCTHNSYKMAGASCTGGVCNGSGTCVPCSPGASCNLGNVCTLGNIGCSTGAPVCSFTSYAPTTTTCGSGDGGTGHCDGMGNCSLCTAGLSCVTGNPCTQGTTSCSPPSCVFSSNTPPGTLCPGGVCNGAGSCVACASGSDCSTGCTLSTISCTSGSPVCLQMGNQPPGTMCIQGGTTGMCDGAGNCVAGCMPGSPCGGSPPECHQAGQTSCSPTTCNYPLQPSGAACWYTSGTCDGSGNCNTTSFDGGGITDTGTTFSDSAFSLDGA